MKNLLKASLITGSAFFVNVFSNTVRAKVAAVFLGPPGVAAFAQINSFVGLAGSLTTLGLATAIVRFIAEYRVDGRVGDLKKLIATAIVFTTLVSLVVTATLLLLAPTLTDVIFGRHMLMYLVVISLLNIPVTVITTVAVAILQGFKEIKLDAAISVFSSLTVMILIVALLIPFKLSGAIWGSLIGNCLTSIVFAYFFVKVLNKHLQRSGGVSSQHVRRNFVFNSLKPLWGIAFASVIVGGIVNLADILVRSYLIHHVGLTEAGVIQPSLSVSAQYTALLGGAIGTYALPRLSELTKQRDQFVTELNDYLRLLLIAITPAACVLAAVAKPLVILLYSSKFQGASALIPIQSIADVIEFVFVAFSGAIFALGRSRALLITGAITPIVYFVGFLALESTLHLRSIPIASVISWAVATIICYRVLQRSGYLDVFPRNKLLISSSLLATTAVALAATFTNPLATYVVAVGAMALWARANISRHEVTLLAQLFMKRVRPS